MWDQIFQRTVDWVLGSGLTIIVAAILMLVLLALNKMLLKRFRNFIAKKEKSPERLKRIDTMVAVLRHVASIVIVFVSLLVIVSELGIDLSPILTTVGITGLAISFGAQSLVKDVISGFFMLLEDQVRVGDVVKVSDHGGIVEAITLRTIRLRDLSGNLHIIPNGEVTSLVNMTKDYSCYTFDVGVSYREDVDRVMQVLREIGDEVGKDPKFGPLIIEPLEVLGLDKFDDSAVIIRARITTQPLQQWKVGREINRRIKKRFDADGIEIPFPHRTIYWGEPKPGRQQGLKVNTEAAAQ